MNLRTVTSVLALLALGCSDSVDKAAKRRIFSPEDPPKAVASASEKLAPEEVAENPQVARRVLRMGAAETTERIGPHKFVAVVTFDWSGPGRTNKLVENRTLVAGPGGVSGDFLGTIENSRDQGLEVLRVRGQVFAKSRYGKFRQRLRDRGMAEREREEIYRAVGDFDDLFLGRMALAPQGTVTHEGRTAWKYLVSLGPPLAAAGEGEAPPPVTPKSGVDETTRRRQLFLEKREPKTLQGEVLVDALTSVVLKAHLDGRISVTSEQGEASLRMVLDGSLTEVGKDPLLRPPTDFLPDRDKPAGIADALDRFGIPHGEQKDAGTGAEEGELPEEVP